ncbi:MAG: class I SAM-dependent methyltransferase [Flavisolibacter sp.]
MHDEAYHITQGQQEFEQQYISLRKEEGRLYTDEEVALLPFPTKENLFKKEWEIRASSCRRLVKYLKSKQKKLKVLEVGCGNGWLTNQLAGVKETQVTGIDINKTELDQAQRIFQKSNLKFVYADIQSGIPEKDFDIIVFAASFQYFNSVQRILSACFGHLNHNGEIHIIDTKFYTPAASIEARQRSRNYFESKGFPQMDEYYFHHSLNDLLPYQHIVLFDPANIIDRFFYKHPFPWICIKK